MTPVAESAAENKCDKGVAAFPEPCEVVGPPMTHLARSLPTKRLQVLCTGGLGYIGSHTVLPLIAAGYAVCVVDSLCNATKEVFKRLQLLLKQQQQEKRRQQQPPRQEQEKEKDPEVHQLHKQRSETLHCNSSTGEEHTAVAGEKPDACRHTEDEEDIETLLDFVQLDLCDFPALLRLFQKRQFVAVIHYAARKNCLESMHKPFDYYFCNVGGTLNLLQAMRMTGCCNFVFSSSATVYEPISERRVCEDDARRARHPYGRTKLFVEEMLEDLHAGEEREFWRISILRYFNPIGAHASGILGEDSYGIPPNLVPYIQQVAVKKLPHVNIYGSDYDTRDGTGVRDYLHVEDLAQGHVAALRHLEVVGRGGEEEERGEDESGRDHQRKRRKHGGGCFHIYNLGTGRGVSTLEMVKTFEEASGQPIPYKFVDSEALRSAWKWQSKNPNGYGSNSSSNGFNSSGSNNNDVNSSSSNALNSSSSSNGLNSSSSSNGLNSSSSNGLNSSSSNGLNSSNIKDVISSSSNDFNKCNSSKDFNNSTCSSNSNGWNSSSSNSCSETSCVLSRSAEAV